MRRLGVFARASIVLSVAWVAGFAWYYAGRQITLAATMSEQARSRCIEHIVQRQPIPGCEAEADKLFHLFADDAWPTGLVGGAVWLLLFGVVAGLAYLILRWVLAGRKLTT